MPENPKRSENLNHERGRRAARQIQKTSLMQANRKERTRRSNGQQLEALDFRLGKGVGATRERFRLGGKTKAVA